MVDINLTAGSPRERDEVEKLAQMVQLTSATETLEFERQLRLLEREDNAIIRELQAVKLIAEMRDAGQLTQRDANNYLVRLGLRQSTLEKAVTLGVVTLGAFALLGFLLDAGRRS